MSGDVGQSAEIGGVDQLSQTVVVTRYGDRHAGLTSEDREFAQSYEVVAPAGPLPDVLRAVADALTDEEPCAHRVRYSLTVSEAHE